jgi:hypothetical protein
MGSAYFLGSTCCSGVYVGLVLHATLPASRNAAGMPNETSVSLSKSSIGTAVVLLHLVAFGTAPSTT